MAANDRLSAKKRRFVRELLSSPTVKGATERTGIGLRTGFRWLQDEAVKAELRRCQDGLLAGLTAGLVGLSGDAVEVLRDVLADPDATDAVRTRAALGWLAHVRQVVELQDLADRVGILEEQSTG